LIESVTCQVLAGRLPSLASIEFKLRIPYYSLLESMPVKQTHERLQSGASRLGGLAGRPTLGPLVIGLCTLPPRVRCILMVTLILV
jgi:hypothetical protein